MNASQGFSLFEVLLALFLISSSIVLLITQQEQNISQVNRLYDQFLGLQSSLYAFNE